MRFHLLFWFLLFVISNISNAIQLKAPDSTILLHNALIKNIEFGLNYLQNTQIKETKVCEYYRGEWKTTMNLEMAFILLGGKRKVDDSNCFSIASTHNDLAYINLLYPEYTNILPMLEMSFQKIMTYRNNNRFNFWNLLPPQRTLKKGDTIGKQPYVRRPTNYKLNTPYINNAANVTEDADDTGLAYTAIALRKKILNRDNIPDTLQFRTDSVAQIFDKYRDLNRRNKHWFNFLYGKDFNTGAYLTWLDEEQVMENWSVLKVLGHNLTFYSTKSECYPHPYVPYIPYGTNDLDAIVNANVLTTLSIYGELNAKGVDSAVTYIERKSKLKDFDVVGTYYPNRYNFHFAVSKSYASGITKLENSATHLVNYIKETQNKDGSWESRKVINNKDVLQSTAYALNALLNFGRIDERNTQQSIEKAIYYILNNSISDENGIHWTGGVFFSGGTVVRRVLFWKSDAYTTAIILHAFANYRKYIEEKYYIHDLEKNNF